MSIIALIPRIGVWLAIKILRAVGRSVWISAKDGTIFAR